MRTWFDGRFHDPGEGTRPRAVACVGMGWLVAAMAITLGGCVGRDVQAPWEVQDSAGVEVITNRAALEEWEVSPEPLLSLGTVDAGGPTDFFRVRSIASLGPRGFVVANGGSEELRFFTPEGEFIRAVGRSGHGPGEYQGLFTVERIGDSLFTYDGGNDRISVLSPDGRFVRSFRLEWFAGLLAPQAFARDGRIIAITARPMTELHGVGRILDSALVSTYDRDGMLIDSLLRIPHNERVVRREGIYQTTVGAPFSAGAQMVAFGGGFCYTFGPVPEVRCHGGDGALIRVARLSGSPREVTPDDIEEYWREQEAARPSAYRDAVRKFRRDMPFPELFPAFDRLLSDDLGRTWARVYAVPESETHEWWILEEGRAMAHLRLPIDFELLRVAGDRLYGVTRDAMDVESVAVLHFQRKE